MVDENGGARTFLFTGHDVVLDESVEQGEGCGRILTRRRQIADFFVGADDHLLQARSVTSGKSAQPASKIVIEHQVPAAEYLLREEIGETAVGRSVAGQRHLVMHVPAQHEQGR